MQQGDKITKRPLQHGKYLIILGRTHIHLFDVQNFTSHYLHNCGEDDAEKWAVKVREMERIGVEGHEEEQEDELLE